MTQQLLIYFRTRLCKVLQMSFNVASGRSEEVANQSIVCYLTISSVLCSVSTEVVSSEVARSS